MRITPCTDSDIAGLVEFMAHWGAPHHPLAPEDVQHQLRHCRERVSGELFLAFDDANQLIGYLQMIETSLVSFPPAAEIAALLVHSDLRGRGIGTRLVEYARQWADTRGLSRLLLSSQLHRKGAHAFYERCGFCKWKESAFFVWGAKEDEQ